MDADDCTRAVILRGFLAKSGAVGAALLGISIRRGVMRARLQLRALSSAEALAVRQLAHSRTAAAAVVQRARVIELLATQPRLGVGAAAQRVGFARADAGA